MINPYKLHTELYRSLESLASTSRIKRAQQDQQPAEQQPTEQQTPPDPTQNALRFWLGDQGAQRFSNIMTRKPKTHTIELPGLARNRFRKTMWISNPFGGGYHFQAPRQTTPYNPYPWMQGGGGGGQQGGGMGMGDNNMMQFLLLKELMSKQDAQSQLLGFIAQIIGAFQPQISEWLEQLKQQQEEKKRQQQQQQQQQQQPQQRPPQQQPQQPQTKQSSRIPAAIKDVAANPLWFVPGLTSGLVGAGLGAGSYILAPYFYTDPVEVKPRQIMLGALLGAISGMSLEIAYRSWAKALS